MPIGDSESILSTFESSTKNISDELKKRYSSLLFLDVSETFGIVPFIKDSI
jgi:dsDNA-specific endonuclease/ATPase MutS2